MGGAAEQMRAGGTRGFVGRQTWRPWRDSCCFLRLMPHFAFQVDPVLGEGTMIVVQIDVPGEANSYDSED